MAGKTGADAVYKAVHHICRLITKFEAKLNSIVDAAQTAGAITPTQAVLAKDLLSAAQLGCAVWQAIAEYNSLTP